MAGGFDVLSPTGEPPNVGNEGFLAALKAKGEALGRTPDALAADFLAIIVATAPLFSRTMVRVVDRMLENPGQATELFLSPPSLSSDGADIEYVGVAVDAVDDIGIRFG